MCICIYPLCIITSTATISSWPTNLATTLTHWHCKELVREVNTVRMIVAWSENNRRFSFCHEWSTNDIFFAACLTDKFFAVSLKIILQVFWLSWWFTGLACSAFVSLHSSIIFLLLFCRSKRNITLFQNSSIDCILHLFFEVAHSHGQGSG